MRKAIAYTGFTQKDGKIEIVQTVSDERIAMDTLIEVRYRLCGAIKAAGVNIDAIEDIQKDIWAVNRVIDLLDKCEE